MAIQMIPKNFTIHDGISFSFYFVTNLLLLQSWLPWRNGYFSFNAVSWYLSTIAFSYCLFPYIQSSLVRNDKKRIYGFARIAIILMVVVAAVLGIGKKSLGWSTDFVKWVTYIFPVYRVGDFVAGIAAGFYFLVQEKSKRKDFVKLSYTGIEIIAVMLIAFQIFLYDFGFRTTNWTLSLFWLPTSITIVYLFAKCRGIVSRKIAEGRILVWLGDISGEAFLIHQIVIKGVGMVIESKIILTIVSFSLTIFTTIVWRKIQGICIVLKNKQRCDY